MSEQIDLEEVVNEQRDHDEIKKIIVEIGLALSGHTPRVMLVAMSAVFSSVVRLRNTPPTKEEIEEMYDILKQETLSDVRDNLPNMFQRTSGEQAVN